MEQGKKKRIAIVVMVISTIILSGYFLAPHIEAGRLRDTSFAARWLFGSFMTFLFGAISFMFIKLTMNYINND